MIARPHGDPTDHDSDQRLSVSARDAPPPPPSPTPPASNANLLLMRRLVDEAAEMARQFQSAMDVAAAREGRARTASIQLQERLRLGARLLQAQQCQIERLERIVGELRTVRQSAELALGRLDARLGRRVREVRELERRRPAR